MDKVMIREIDNEVALRRSELEELEARSQEFKKLSEEEKVAEVLIEELTRYPGTTRVFGVNFYGDSLGDFVSSNFFKNSEKYQVLLQEIRKFLSTLRNDTYQGCIEALQAVGVLYKRD